MNERWYFLSLLGAVKGRSKDPEGVRSLNLGAIWNFSTGTGLLCLGHQIVRHKGPVLKAYVHRDRKGSNPFTILFCSRHEIDCPDISLGYNV
jgi:hypothetical protein